MSDAIGSSATVSSADGWASVSATMRGEMGEPAWRNWLAQLQPGERVGDCQQMVAPTAFLANWVGRHYADRILSLWQASDPSLGEIKLIVGAPLETPAETGAGQAATQQQQAPAAAAPAAPVVTPTPAREEDSFLKSAGLDPRFTFDNYVVGKSNEFAYAAARRVAESGRVSFNPLFLHGDSGLGKTHLMHAIAWGIQEQFPERKVVYMSAEKFMYQFVRAIRYKNTVSFKDQFRSVDVLMIDDVQFIAGRETTQEEFFHTFNALVDQNRQIIISADKSPSELTGLEERLRSRLNWGLVADIHPTTYELRLGILQSRVEASGMDIPARVIEFIAHKISSNVRELEGALNRIIAHVELIGRDITVETAADVLRDLIRANDRRVTIDEILQKVASHYALKVSDLKGPRRSRDIARPRQIAMFLAKKLTERSLPEIGRQIGGRDHTTIMHGVAKITELSNTDPDLAEDVELLKRTLAG
ncbi:MAG: chromosomal replication initiator protein DnaA [Alphaproteobacteria bacterium]